MKMNKRFRILTIILVPLSILFLLYIHLVSRPQLAKSEVVNVSDPEYTLAHLQLSGNRLIIDETPIKVWSPLDRKLDKLVQLNTLPADEPYILDDFLLQCYLYWTARKLLKVAASIPEYAVSAKMIYPNVTETPNLRLLFSSSPTLNAYATGLNNIVIFHGMLLHAKQESAFNFVLGHEISHILCGHTYTHLTRIKESILSDGGGAGLIRALLRTDLCSSQDLEREADRLGFSLCVESGVEPFSIIKWFPLTKMYRTSEDCLFQKEREQYYTHPCPETRHAFLGSLLPKLQYDESKADINSLDFDLFLTRSNFLSGKLCDVSGYTCGVPQDPTINRPGMAEAPHYYGRALAKYSAGDYTGALAELRKSRDLVEHPMGSILELELLAKLGEPYSESSFMKMKGIFHERYGEAISRRAASHILKVYGRYNQAISELEGVGGGLRFRDFYKDLSELYAEIGDKDKSDLYLGEYLLERNNIIASLSCFKRLGLYSANEIVRREANDRVIFIEDLFRLWDECL